MAPWCALAPPLRRGASASLFCVPACVLWRGGFPQTHTHTHPCAPFLSQATAEQEFQHSRKVSGAAAGAAGAEASGSAGGGLGSPTSSSASMHAPSFGVRGSMMLFQAVSVRTHALHAHACMHELLFVCASCCFFLFHDKNAFAFSSA